MADDGEPGLSGADPDENETHAQRSSRQNLRHALGQRLQVCVWSWRGRALNITILYAENALGFLFNCVINIAWNNAWDPGVRFPWSCNKAFPTMLLKSHLCPILITFHYGYAAVWIYNIFGFFQVTRQCLPRWKTDHMGRLYDQQGNEMLKPWTSPNQPKYVKPTFYSPAKFSL